MGWCCQSKAELETLNNKRRSVAETLKKQKDEAARKAPPSHDDAAEYEEVRHPPPTRDQDGHVELSRWLRPRDSGT